MELREPFSWSTSPERPVLRAASLERATKALQLGWIVLAGIAAVAATMAADEAGLPTYDIVLVGLAGAAAVLVGLAAIVVLTDHVVSARADRLEAARVADRLEALLRAGRRTMSVAELTDAWLDQRTSDEGARLYLNNAHLRAVKKLVKAGMIRGAQAPGEAITAATLVNTEDAVHLFRSKAV